MESNMSGARTGSDCPIGLSGKFEEGECLSSKEKIQSAGADLLNLMTHREAFTLIVFYASVMVKLKNLCTPLFCRMLLPFDHDSIQFSVIIVVYIITNHGYQ